MRRFFRSAAFPILIVIVLAFFAQRLISPGEKEETPTYNEFLAQIENDPESIKTVTLAPKTQTRKVVETDDEEYSTGYPPNTEESLVNTLQRNEIDTDVECTGGVELPQHPHLHPPVPPVLRVLDLPDEPDAGRRLTGDELRQVQGEADVGRRAEDHLPRRRRGRRGRAGAARDQGVPREPEEVPVARRPHPQGRPALRASRHREDAARARRRGRGRRAVLLDLRLRLRRDVRRRRRLAAFATSSSRPSRTPPASSSWTRSTPSAATAAPAWAAATTSASRP